MRRFKVSPRRALAATTVGALAVTGVTFALWTESLTINGNVDTGDLDVAIVHDATYDYVGGPNHSGDPYADCATVQGSDLNSITITVTDAYPGMFCRVWYHLDNDGTVGAKVASVADVVTGLPGGVDKNDVFAITPAVINNPGYGLTGTIIEPGASSSGQAFDIHIKPSVTNAQLDQNAAVTFTRTFNFENVDPIAG